MVEELINNAKIAVFDGKIIESTDMLVNYLDNALSSGNMPAANDLLSKIDSTRFPPQIITSLLMILSHIPKSEVSDYIRSFQKESIASLGTTHNWSDESINRLNKRIDNT